MYRRLFSVSTNDSSHDQPPQQQKQQQQHPGSDESGSQSVPRETSAVGPPDPASLRHILRRRDQLRAQRRRKTEPLADISGQATGIHVGSRRGRLVTFYRNGDPHFKGLNASISQKAFVSMESLLVWLGEKIPTTSGVRHILRLPDGRPVRDVAELQPGGRYAVSGVRRLVRGLEYGGGDGAAVDGSEKPWLTEARDPSSVAGRMRPSDIRLLARRDSRHYQQLRHRRNGIEESSISSSQSVPPRGVRLITVVSNSHRGSREKVLVNPGTRLTFEDLLADFASLLIMSGPPVRALYTALPPYRRVESFSQLFREFKDHDTFIACGRELSPVELAGSGGSRSGDVLQDSRSPAVRVERQPENGWHQSD